LRTDGHRIVGQQGEAVALAGNSLFWSQWEDEYWNAQCVDWLKDDWKASVVRAAMGVVPDGYLANPDRERARVEAVVDAATKAGIYVIIDWHDHRAFAHKEAAIAFFQTMAKKFGAQDNVIYEIFNEPEEVSWSKRVKPYAEHVIAAIRAIDPSHLIVVGTPRWSQDVDVAAADPIQDRNLAYALHFYAGTHKQRLRTKAEKAMNHGVALFVTEWGTCDANGRGKIDTESTDEWMAFMKKWRLSHCNWAISDKLETASAVRPDAPPTGKWTDADLTPSGRLARRWVREWAEIFPNETAPAE
jgi:aryl-phospho-beta-D-glucosidase BglC (GH1 family)